jgi:hypothetical protein
VTRPLTTPVDRTPPAPLDALVRTTLVYCEGGPKGGEVFWAGALADRQRAALRTQTPHTPPAALAALHYRPTNRTRKVAKLGDITVVTYRALEVVR